MTTDQINEVKKAVKEVIQSEVNGKIDKINIKIDNYIQQDDEWKKRAEPVITMGENMQGFGKVSLYVVGFIASVTGAIIAITHLVKNK